MFSTKANDDSMTRRAMANDTAAALQGCRPCRRETRKTARPQPPCPHTTKPPSPATGAPTSPGKGSPRTCRRLLRYGRSRPSWRKLPYRQIGPRKIHSKSRSEKREVEPQVVLARSEVPYTSAATIRETSARIASCFVIEPGASPR